MILLSKMCILCCLVLLNSVRFKLFSLSVFLLITFLGARCSSVVRAFAHGVMGRRIDPPWGGPIELFLVLASAPRLV